MSGNQQDRPDYQEQFELAERLDIERQRVRDWRLKEEWYDLVDAILPQSVNTERWIASTLIQSRESWEYRWRLWAGRPKGESIIKNRPWDRETHEFDLMFGTIDKS